jgi:hypothetical protein
MRSALPVPIVCASREPHLPDSGRQLELCSTAAVSLCFLRTSLLYCQMKCFDTQLDSVTLTIIFSSTALYTSTVLYHSHA